MKRKTAWSTHSKALICVAMVCVVAIAAFVSAYFLRKSGDVVNEFKPAESVLPEVVETFTQKDEKFVKENVCFDVGITDDYPVYVRAAIVITWKNEKGVVYYKKPVEGQDYSLTLNISSDGWTKRDDDEFYYYKPYVLSGKKTGILIEKCEQLDTAIPPAEGYSLSVELVVQTVQAIGSTDGENGAPIIDAWKDAWASQTEEPSSKSFISE